VSWQDGWSFLLGSSNEGGSDTHRGRLANVRYWQILLQKSFWGDERKFLEPLMRFTRGDVGTHIVSSKIDHGSPS
jgi:hypothetical protein